MFEVGERVKFVGPGPAEIEDGKRAGVELIDAALKIGSIYTIKGFLQKEDPWGFSPFIEVEEDPGTFAVVLVRGEKRVGRPIWSYRFFRKVPKVDTSKGMEVFQKLVKESPVLV